MDSVNEGRASSVNRSSRPSSLYEALLDDRFLALHPNVRAAHVPPLTAEGVFDVVHGSHRLTPILVTLMKLPEAGTGLPVVFRVALDPRQGSPGALSVWRRIGRSILETRQFARRGRLVEESWPGRLVFSLREADGALIFDHVSSRLLYLPVPSPLAPKVRASASPDAHGWRVDVVVEWRGHLICRYWGRMRPVQASP